MPETKPRYVEIADHIRERITRGSLRPGDVLTSERLLAEEWEVARPTVTKALDVLRREGFIASRSGSGTYVVDRSDSVAEFGDGLIVTERPSITWTAPDVEGFSVTWIKGDRWLTIKGSGRRLSYPYPGLTESNVRHTVVRLFNEERSIREVEAGQ